ncbi:sensor domain-containing diguanylate cyclase [Saccharopolyspora rhizosphaerae]|uniref:Sensor domain-containing diguanylate cyclase n=1 Tax=Saccharopolyspora rhizosphaerae TaxID=2492662 RepID=A0A3R8Q9C6_9PSEU|nr:sensor domain-containing diguanylate cyclase [Saccharopolyspora rhizosphaerae]RRO19870.1 sensor domain-containing diguanylate cyclase [Saccharopolyspora rhizosphaerae]
MSIPSEPSGEHADAALWQTLFEQSAAAMAILDLQGKYLHVNAAFCRMLGYARDELIGLDYRAITHPDDIDDEGPIEAEEPLEKRYIRADGSVIWVLVSRSFIRDENGEPVRFLSQSQDITRRREAELLWQRSFHNAPIGMALLDLKGHWTEVNDTLCDMLGYTRDEMVGMHFSEVTYEEDDDRGPALLEDLVHGVVETLSIEKRYRHKKGHPIWMLIRATAVPGADGAPAFVVSQYDDVGERRLADAHLAQLALHDPLTGLANRTLLSDLMDLGLKRIASGDGMLLVVLADLDDLKPFNDRYGHLAGDKVIVAAAKALQGAVRGGDAVARIGGDEFVVVTVVNTAAEAAALRDRIEQQLNRDVTIGGRTVELRTSVGHAITNDPEVTRDQLLHAADQDMYERKRNRSGGRD